MSENYHNPRKVQRDDFEHRDNQISTCTANKRDFEAAQQTRKSLSGTTIMALPRMAFFTGTTSTTCATRRS